MLRVRLDGLDDQVQLVGTVDLSRYGVIALRRIRLDLVKSYSR